MICDVYGYYKLSHFLPEYSSTRLQSSALVIIGTKASLDNLLRERLRKSINNSLQNTSIQNLISVYNNDFRIPRKFQGLTKSIGHSQTMLYL